MPYNINRYNGTLVTTVEDGTVDNTLDIKLIGRNYAGYGEVQNENMVFLLENFAGSSEPSRKVSGQIWYDSGTKKLKFYDGTKFRTTGGAEVGAIEPSGLTTGDFWFNTETSQLYAWDGASFILVGPQAVENAGTTELKSVSVIDVNGTTHAIVKALVNNKTIFVTSSAEFILPDNTIEGFKVVKKGVTLVDTMVLSNSDVNYGITSSDYIFWGTSSNSLKLNGKSASDFVLAGTPEFQGLVSFGNSGYTLGSQDTLQAYIDNNGDITFRCIKLDGSINFLTRVTADQGATDKKPMKLQGNDILPGQHLVSNIGRSDLKFGNVYALDFYGTFRGTATSAESVKVDDTYRTGSLAATPNTVAARDTNGAITATQFIGLASRTSNINGGAPGAIPYQSNANTTTFLSLGNTNEILSVNSLGQLDWVPLNSLINAGDAERITVRTADLVNSTHYITFTNATSGYQDLKVDATGLVYNPNTNTLTTQFFNGQSSRATYADLAEKFLADKDYEIGTVVVVGGEKEVTASSYAKRAIGVVSEKPAFLMNDDLENGTMVALKGRVPVKVIGPIKKGDKLVAHHDGTAIHSYSSLDIFAIALESSDESGVHLIECVIL
ncbi:hypothetical protein EBU71_11855 [bacterium]|nr:hypothetical protein [Candidatus Elulimicrobium humile]